MIAIITKYLPATNSRGSRIKATASDKVSITIGYPHELSGIACHAKAARALCDKMGWNYKLVGGGMGNGYAFAMVRPELIPSSDPFRDDIF